MAVFLLCCLNLLETFYKSININENINARSSLLKTKWNQVCPSNAGIYIYDCNIFATYEQNSSGVFGNNDHNKLEYPEFLDLRDSRDFQSVFPGLGVWKLSEIFRNSDFQNLLKFSEPTENRLLMGQ